MKKVILCLVLSFIALFSNAEVTSLWNQLDLQVRFTDPTVQDVPIQRSPIETCMVIKTCDNCNNIACQFMQR